MDVAALINSFIYNPFFLQCELIALFLNGLLSSVIPIPTELATTPLLAAGEEKLSVFMMLSSSSVIEGFLAYYIGRSGKTLFRHFHKKPNKEDEEKGHGFPLNYGWIGIFFCPWIPVLGDVIPIVPGTKKYDIQKFAIAMSVGRSLKLLAIVYISNFFAPLLLQHKCCPTLNNNRSRKPNSV